MFCWVHSLAEYVSDDEVGEDVTIRSNSPLTESNGCKQFATRVPSMERLGIETEFTDL
jgi:hypothetical protein